MSLRDIGRRVSGVGSAWLKADDFPVVAKRRNRGDCYHGFPGSSSSLQARYWSTSPEFSATLQRKFLKINFRFSDGFQHSGRNCLWR